MSLQDINLPESKQDVQDIDLSATAKKRFRINGDDNKIIYLNTSDMLAIERFRETYPKLMELAQDASDKLVNVNTDEFSETELDKTADILKDINTKMCEYVDFIFDCKVAEICCDGGSMYDPFDGQLRFQHIFEKLFALYKDNISKEFKTMSNRMKRHTDKYTVGKKS